MSRGSVARRRRCPEADPWLEERGEPQGQADERDQTIGRLTRENEELKSQVEEVEGWYLLLQADHAALQHREGRADLRATDLQAEVHRLSVENEELRALVARNEDAGPQAGRSGDGFPMTRITEVLQSIRRHKWATAAVVAIGTLLARDPAVQGLAGSVAARVRQAVDRHRDGARDEADSGFLRYATLI